MKHGRPSGLSTELNWCELHGGWDPCRGAIRMCHGCATGVAMDEVGRARFYAMHPTEALEYVRRVASRHGARKGVGRG